jgi:hypothetical protein
MVSVSINSLYLFVVITKIRGKAAVWRWGGIILKIIKKSHNYIAYHMHQQARKFPFMHCKTEKLLF